MTTKAMCLALLVVALGGCKDDHHGSEGTATGALCTADADGLTYESFGRPFMTDFCVRCHSSTLTGAARMDAPAGHDFDTLAGILVVADHIDEYAAAGPNATNRIMPPTAPDADRRAARAAGRVAGLRAAAGQPRADLPVMCGPQEAPPWTVRLCAPCRRR